jgi:hypothetical protein
MLELVGIFIGIAVVIGVGATAVFVGACLALRWVLDNYSGSARRGRPGGARAPMQAPPGRHQADPDPYANFQRRNY